MKVNYILQMNEAYLRLSEEKNITSAHLAMYWTLFQLWNLSKFQDEISICRSEVMRLARIGSKTTYYKTLKDLEQMGYLTYIPSNNPLRASLVKIHIFDSYTTVVPNSGTLLHSHDHEPSHNQDNQLVNLVPYSGQQVGPSINSINNKPIKHENKKREKINFSPPSIEELKSFFIFEGSYTSEAENFYNYFQSNGWLVGGKAKMKDWQAAARNWIKRSANFKPPQKPNDRLTTNNEKDYAMPL